MFAASEAAVVQGLECRREARRCELREICEREARDKQRVMQIVREAEDDGDWRAAGCSSSAQWLAQVYRSDHRSAVRITRTSDALRSLPALDQAMSTGALTLDQVAAATEFATPASDAELARMALGRAPSEISLAARTLVPPAVADDQALYQRRALSMSWTRGRRELAFSGRLPLEQGVAFEQAIWQVAKTQRALDKQAGTVLDRSSPPPSVFRPALRIPEIKTSLGFAESRRSAYLVGADPRRRCDDRKRLVLATCTRSQPRAKCRVLQRDLRALHGSAREPSASLNPLYGRGGDHRAHSEG